MALFLFFLAAGSIQAQTDSLPADSLRLLELPAVELTATRLAFSSQRAPLAVSVVDQALVQRAQPQLSLQESMQAVPGVFTLNAENFAQDLRIAIRGFGARAAFGIRGIKLLVDGVPESTPDGQAQLDNLDLGLVERIEVVRGPSSGLYGNASGGVISIRTQQAGENPYVEGRLSVGSYGFQRYQLKTAAQLGKFQYVLYNAYTQIKGYREHSGMKNNLLNARLQLEPDSLSRIVLLFNHLYSPQADDAGALTLDQMAENPRQARDRNLAFATGEEVEQGRLALQYQRRLAKGHQLRLRSYYLYRDFNNRLPFETGGRVSLNRTYWGGGLNYLYQGKLLGLEYHSNVGLDVDIQNDHRQRFDNLQGEQGEKRLDQDEAFRSTAAFWMQKLRLLPAWELSLGMRLDVLHLEARDAFLTNGDDSGSLSYRQFNPIVGMSYVLGPGMVLYTNLATSFESPALSELSANPAGSGGFNAELKPQRATNYELGLRGEAAGKLAWDLALFSIALRDELVPYELPDFPGRTFFRNAGRSARKGIEASLKWRIIKSLELQSSYTYSDFRYREYTTPDGNFEGNRLPAIPPHHFYLGLTYQASRGFMARLQLRRVGEMYAEDFNEVRIAPFTTLNMQLAYPLVFNQWEMEFFMGVNNLLDATYPSNIRINAFGMRYVEPATGRFVFGGMRLRLGKPGQP